MEKMLEIRWHGRGGQGVKTAALLLADVAFTTGKYVQGFPEYGPERMGAPVTAYNRICNLEIRNHSNIYEPDYVVVVDESLLQSVNVVSGLKPGGCVLVNTAHTPKKIRGSLKDYDGRVLTIDAKTISQELLGAYFPNMPMLAGVIRMTGFMDEQIFLENMESSLRHKFAAKPQAAAGNLNVLKRALGEVNGL